MDEKTKAQWEARAPKGQALIGYVEATVRFPLYEGDDLLSDEFPWFVYDAPGIAPDGYFATCRRECQTVSAKVVKVELSSVETS